MFLGADSPSSSDKLFLKIEVGSYACFDCGRSAIAHLQVMSCLRSRIFSLFCALSFSGSCAHGDVFFLTYDSRLTENDISVTNHFNGLRNFNFTIDVAAALTPGGVYTNPLLNSVNYNIYGVLTEATPSGFTAFDLMRTIGGSEFYTQGSSFSFEIDAAADLGDGLQASELVGFTFNGRELDTGRFHPALLTLDSVGTGSLTNSNNFSTSPPAPRNVIVDFGDEYDVSLSFDASSLTLVAIPEPRAAAVMLGGFSMLLLALRRRRA